MQSLNLTTPQNWNSTITAELDRLDEWSQKCQGRHDETLILACLDDTQHQVDRCMAKQRNYLYRIKHSIKRLREGPSSSFKPLDIFQRIEEIRARLLVLEQLPDDCWLKICKFLNFDTQLMLAYTQRRFFQLIHANPLWRARIWAYLTVDLPFKIRFKEPSLKQEMSRCFPDDVHHKLLRCLFFKPESERKPGDDAVFSQPLAAVYARPSCLRWTRGYYNIIVNMSQVELEFAPEQPILEEGRAFFPASTQECKRILAAVKIHLCGWEDSATLSDGR